EHDAVFADEFFFLMFEDVPGGGSAAMVAAGIDSVLVILFDGRIGVAEGIKEAFADLVAEFCESLSAAFHPFSPVECDARSRSIVSSFGGMGAAEAKNRLKPVLRTILRTSFPRRP